MAVGKYPRFSGETPMSEVLADPDVQREIPELMGLRNSHIARKLTAGAIFEATGTKILQNALGISHREARDLGDKFWTLFDLFDRKNYLNPKSYEQETAELELEKLVQDLEQAELFGVYMPESDLTAKRARARELHNSLRQMKGKAPKPAKGKV